MAQCPVCKCEGADIMLNRVFCTNTECTWFDQVQYDRVTKAVAVTEFIRSMNELDDKLSDPDITPVWHPDFKD